MIWDRMTIRASYQMKVPGEDRYGSILVREDRETELDPCTHEDREAAVKALHAACRNSVEAQVNVIRDIHPAPAPAPRDVGGAPRPRSPPKAATDKQKAFHRHLVGLARKHGCQVTEDVHKPADASYAYAQAIDALKAALAAKGVPV